MAKNQSTKKGMRAAYAQARRVNPRPITGRERPIELLEHAFPAYVGRQERTGYELMRRSFDEGASVFLTLSGAMTPAGLHQSCLIPLIERGVISALTTTGANLYHDAHRIIGHAIREVNPNAGDLQMRLARVIRIYDLGFWEEALLDTDRLFSAIMRGPEFQRKMTTPEFHFLLGKAVYRIEKQLGVKQPSLLSTCYKHAVPIWVGAVQDGSIFLNVVKLRRLLGEQFKFELDINEDVYSMAAMQHYARHHFNKRLAIWILGGGVPKNYTLQGEPLLDQILGVPTQGFDIDVQFCVDPVDNGALSSCPAGEGHTWGKVSVEAVETGSVYVHTDVTAVFPWLTHALLSDPKVKRRPQRLMDLMGDAVKLLDRDVQRRRKKLMETIDWHPGEVPKDTGHHHSLVRGEHGTR
ncbi:MAG: deoxyhypusine synthase family protein [Myxococcaceae bacterium]|nr:deoxyhypusine synthase family protein [Myxococcaceae bacterium]MCI0673136.1 deoxyhypusine synthase family protein [Myxococcaceae bacterium]